MRCIPSTDLDFSVFSGLHDILNKQFIVSAKLTADDQQPMAQPEQVTIAEKEGEVLTIPVEENLFLQVAVHGKY